MYLGLRSFCLSVRDGGEQAHSLVGLQTSLNDNLRQGVSCGSLLSLLSYGAHSDRAPGRECSGHSGPPALA